MKVFALAKNTFREAIRNKIVYSVVAFAVAIVAVSTFFGSVSLGDRNQVVTDFGLFGMTLCGAMITILLGVTLLNKELKQKTVYHILSKPLTRAEFVIGKQLGLALTVITLVVGMGLALFGFLLLIDAQPPLRLALSLYFTSLEMIVLSSIVLFFSSMVVTITLPGLLAFGTFVAGHAIENFADLARQFEKSNPGFRSFIDLLSWIVPDLSLFNINEQLVYNLPVSTAYTLSVTVYALCYSVIALGLAILIFDRKEFR